MLVENILVPNLKIIFLLTTAYGNNKIVNLKTKTFNIMKYNVERECRDCKNTDLYPFSKTAIAFKLYDETKIWQNNCTKCGSINSSFVSYENLFDKELLDIWGYDTALHFIDQDEEIILAEMDNLVSILQAIDEAKYPKSKISVLVQTICILLYDNVIAEEEYTKEENLIRSGNATIVRTELVKRKDTII